MKFALARLGFAMWLASTAGTAIAEGPARVPADAEPSVVAIVSSSPDAPAAADGIAEVAAAALTSHGHTVVRGPVVRGALDRLGTTADGCLRDAACLGRMAVALGAQRTLAIEWRRAAGGGSVYAMSVSSTPGEPPRRWAPLPAADLSLVTRQVRQVAGDLLQPSVLLSVEVDRSGGALSVDEQPWLFRGLKAEARVSPGVHRVEWVAADGRRIQTEVHCRLSAICELSLEGPAPPGARPTTVARGFAWGTLALAAASAGVGAALAVKSKALEGDVQGACPDGLCNRTEAQMRALTREGERYETGANVMFGLAGAAALASVALFVVDAVSEPAPTEASPAGAGDILFRPNGFSWKF